jgi:hypothetical protein
MDEKAKARAKRYYEKNKEKIKQRKIITLDGVRPKLQEMDLKANTKKTYLASLKRLETIFPNLLIVPKMTETIDASAYSTSTKRVMVQALLFLCNKFEIKVTDDILAEWRHYLNVLKVRGGDELEGKMKDVVLTWDEYLSKLKTEYGLNSKEYLIASLYREVPVRDDFQLKIVTTLPEDTKTNYVIMKPIVTIVLNVFKTKDSYGAKTHVLSKELSKRVRDYGRSRDLKVDDYLFGSGKLGTFITQMNKRIGVDGAINLLRHMSVTELMASNPTAEQRATLAEKMGHSVGTQVKYERTNGAEKEE